MKCPLCNSTDTAGKYVEFLQSDHFTCIECESTWLANNGVIDQQNITPGSAHRALQRQIDNDTLAREFNDPESALD